MVVIVRRDDPSVRAWTKWMSIYEAPCIVSKHPVH